MLHILLRGIMGLLQLTLDRYFAAIGAPPTSKQAFSKARRFVNPEYVRKFADGVSEIFAKSDDMPTYLGMRLIAIDGTDVALENSEELKQAFGCSGPKRNAATALASIAYGPLDHAIYDCQIAPYATDERQLAMKHMARLLELGLGGSLLLFDRWYPSKEFIANTLNSGFSFENLSCNWRISPAKPRRVYCRISTLPSILLDLLLPAPRMPMRLSQRTMESPLNTREIQPKLHDL